MNRQFRFCCRVLLTVQTWTWCVCVFDLLKELYERPCSWQKTSLAVRMPQAEPLSFHWHGYSSHLICNEAVLDDSESLWPWLLTGRALASWREVPYALSFGSKIRHVGEKSGAHKPFLHITLYTHYSHTHTLIYFSAYIHIFYLLRLLTNCIWQSPGTVTVCNMNHQELERILDCLFVRVQVTAAEGALFLLFGHEAMPSERSPQRWHCSPRAAGPSQPLASGHLQRDRARERKNYAQKCFRIYYYLFIKNFW